MRYIIHVVAALAVSASVATAGLLPVSVTATPTEDGNRFTYGILLESDSTLKKGDFFTIYDFAGLLEGTNLQPMKFSFSTTMTGPTPSRVVAEDDPSLPNLTWTYTGNDTLVGQLGLGSFSAESRYPHLGYDDFSGQTHRTIDGHVNSNITDSRVPVPCSQVPEPASFLLLGLAAPLLLAMRRRS